MNAHKLNVLVVDDCIEILRFLTDLLQENGHAVVTASTGLDGILKATQNIDVAILDFMLPALDGLSVCEELRKNTETANIFVVFMTGYADERLLNACIDRGDSVLSKPINCDVLLSTLAVLAGDQHRDRPCYRARTSSHLAASASLPISEI